MQWRFSAAIAFSIRLRLSRVPMLLHERSYFRLTSPSKALDRRVHAARGDLADVALAGKIFVPHYAEPYSKSVITERVGVYHKPSDDAVMDSELLRGERFAVLDISGDWAWGYCVHDHYVGYVHAHQLGELISEVAQEVNPDYVATGLAFVGSPYLWGGRCRAGIDCSGLVQVALAGAGIAAPRDADLQMLALGRPLDAAATLARGDLIFFPGHVGVMIDGTNMVHATGFHGKTLVEPLDVVTARIAEQHAQPILARKRLS
jgi:hypothetical protein